MLESIPNIIAQKHGINLSGKQNEIHKEGRLVKVVWFIDDGTFTFYSNGDWDFEVGGKFEEGHTNPPTQKIWVKRLEKLYWREYAIAEVFEWKSLTGKR